MADGVQVIDEEGVSNDSSGDAVTRMSVDTTATTITAADRRRPKARTVALRGRNFLMLVVVTAAVTLAGCAENVVRHGHHFRQTDLQQLSPGMGQDQVRASLGTPTTTSPLKTGSAYYYISQTTKQSAFFAPSEIDRQVVAVYFTPTGGVERVAQYGMKDGKVFDYITRSTPSANTNDETVVQQLFRNLGKRGSVFGE